MKQWNRNLCDIVAISVESTGSSFYKHMLTKKSENQGFHHNFPVTYKSYSPSIEFIIISQSRHEKELVLCLQRIWSDV